jgi:hypothetical protein
MTSAVVDRETAQQLGISDDQRSQALESLREMREEFSSAGGDAEAMAKLLKKADEKLATFLSEDQKGKWEDMLGKPAGQELLAKIRAAAARSQ